MSSHSRYREAGGYQFQTGQIVGRNEIYSNGVKIYTGNAIINQNDGPSYFSKCWDSTGHRRKKGVYVEGGDFDLVSQQVLGEPLEVDIWSKAAHNVGIAYRYVGLLFPVFQGTSVSTAEISGAEGDVRKYGAEAFKKYTPGRPKVDLGTAIAELRDAPRLLQFRLARLLSLKNAGSDYLNVQFGWKPLISDCKKTYSTLKNADKVLRAIAVHNGKWTLRKGPVRQQYDVLETWDKNLLGFTPAPAGQILASYSVHGVATFEQRVWFSGRFRYYIPNIDSLFGNSTWRLNTMRKLLGITITPATVWELMPWSWLIDYFGNVGDVISNISGGALDPVAKYAYVLGTTTRRITQTSVLVARDGQSISATRDFKSCYKQRAHANPFGLFFDGGQLSPRQIAILTALGLSRMPS